MKTVSDIGDAIRARGGKVGYTALAVYLSNFKPEVQHGKKVKLFSDEVAEQTIVHFLGKNKKQVITQTIEDRLIHIEKMITKLLDSLGEKE